MTDSSEVGIRNAECGIEIGTLAGFAKIGSAWRYHPSNEILRTLGRDFSVIRSSLI